MLFKNNDEQEIAPEYVNEALAGDLHGFKWAEKYRKFLQLIIIW